MDLVQIPTPFPTSILCFLHYFSFRMFSNEDVTIGAWMLAMNVNHENNHELCATDCTATSIAVWDIPKCSGWCFSQHHDVTASVFGGLYLDISWENLKNT